MEKAVRAFYQFHKRYQKDRPEIMIGLYYPNGGTDGEFGVRWYMHNTLVARLEIFDDAWAILPSFDDFLKAITDKDGASPDEIATLLVGLGIEDWTFRDKRDRT